MSLLELKNIGKIYVSENNVSVGIRGVNLSFERGEFVAITGQSGSGKSTLLNVISGMDSYEEGEMYIEGEETSPYVQDDWEKYREKYISFIFQDYNIIDSFTVLENVELSLLHIQNPKERRKRALELLKRVGMEAHIRHKGSHLSGGQKQRTVIARALAKDSPIILADEPTGNLDSATSKEIIELLKEVSKDKLLIVVTHNFEEVEAHATREIRIYDGAVASDRVLAARAAKEPTVQEEKSERTHPTMRNSMVLGFTIFKSMPRLTTFLCILIMLSSGFIFFMFASFWSEIRIFFVDDNYMFSNIPGRVVVVREDGQVITPEELEKLQQDTGAKRVMSLDYGLDHASLKEWLNAYDDYDDAWIPWIGNEKFIYTYGQDDKTPDVGRYPEAEDEILLRVPYLMKDRYDTGMEYPMNMGIYSVSFRVVGICYYMDSRKQGEVLFTQAGYEKYMSLLYLCERYSLSLEVKVDQETQSPISLQFDRSVLPGVIYYPNAFAQNANIDISLQFLDDKQEAATDQEVFRIDLNFLKLEKDPNSGLRYAVLNPETILPEVFAYVSKHYRQASLFYSSKSEAKKAAGLLDDKGYIAITADTTYKLASYYEIVELVIMGILYLIIWAFLIAFLSFFIRICTKKAMDAFKSNIAIMRSMGIRVFEIKAAVYFRTFLCVLPSVIVLPIFSYFLYRTGFGARNLVYMEWPGFLVIFAIVMLVVMRVTKKHVANLFSENVRKALKGGNE